MCHFEYNAALLLLLGNCRLLGLLLSVYELCPDKIAANWKMPAKSAHFVPELMARNAKKKSRRVAKMGEAPDIEPVTSGNISSGKFPSSLIHLNHGNLKFDQVDEPNFFSKWVTMRLVDNTENAGFTNGDQKVIRWMRRSSKASLVNFCYARKALNCRCYSACKLNALLE